MCMGLLNDLGVNSFFVFIVSVKVICTLKIVKVQNVSLWMVWYLLVSVTGICWHVTEDILGCCLEGWESTN